MQNGFRFCKSIQTLLQGKCLEKHFRYYPSTKNIQGETTKDFIALINAFPWVIANNFWVCVNLHHFLRLFMDLRPSQLNRLQQHISNNFQMHLKKKITHQYFFSIPFVKFVHEFCIREKEWLTMRKISKTDNNNHSTPTSVITS